VVENGTVEVEERDSVAVDWVAVDWVAEDWVAEDSEEVDWEEVDWVAVEDLAAEDSVETLVAVEKKEYLETLEVVDLVVLGVQVKLDQVGEKEEPEGSSVVLEEVSVVWEEVSVVVLVKEALVDKSALMENQVVEEAVRVLEPQVIQSRIKCR
jgi:hypothetical protein